MLQALQFMMDVVNRRQYKLMTEIHKESQINNIMEKTDKQNSSDETCPVWVYGSIVIRDPETQKEIVKIPG